MDLLELYNWPTETESTVMTESHAARGLALANVEIKKHSVVEAIISVLQAQTLRPLTGWSGTQPHWFDGLRRRRSRVLWVIGPYSASKAKAHEHKLRRRIHMLEGSSTKLCSTQTSVKKQFTDLQDLAMEKNTVCLNFWLLIGCMRRLAMLRNECGTHHNIIGEGVTDQKIEECLTSRPPLIEKLFPMSDNPDRLIQAIIVWKQMIKLEHSDSPQIAQWQDEPIEDWGELRKLLKTEGELLQPAGTRLLLLNRCESGSVAGMVIFNPYAHSDLVTSFDVT
ncbi:hypothetical protein ACTXT7_002568 [Hymenolepis weldensis]